MKQESMVSGNSTILKTGKPLTISELAKRHQNDPNHTTSDEELRNAKLELTGEVKVDDESLYEVDNTTVFPAMDFEKEETEEDDDKSKEEDDDDYKSGGRVPNPYDVLG